MKDYKVKEGAGVIIKGKKGYFAGEVVQLTDKEAERLKKKVDPVEVKLAEKKAEKVNDLSELKYDELKSMADGDENVKVEGTGKNGAITKDDLVDALKKAGK